MLKCDRLMKRLKKNSTGTIVISVTGIFSEALVPQVTKHEFGLVYLFIHSVTHVTLDASIIDYNLQHNL
jgi:hypothetical protein